MLEQRNQCLIFMAAAYCLRQEVSFIRSLLMHMLHYVHASCCCDSHTHTHTHIHTHTHTVPGSVLSPPFLYVTLSPHTHNTHMHNTHAHTHTHTYSHTLTGSILFPSLSLSPHRHTHSVTHTKASTHSSPPLSPRSSLEQHGLGEEGRGQGVLS